MKNKIQYILFFIGILIATFASQQAISQTSYINLGSSQQTISGFGGMNFPRWISDLTSAQVDKAFGNGIGQIGLSILRISVSPNSNDWYLELPTAQRASSYGAKILGTPWSPPASMKNNYSTIKGELRTDSYGDYADYLSNFANYMSSNGAALYAISVQNEPDWLPDYESCGWSYTQMYNFVRYYADRIPTRVLAAEALGFNHAYTDPILNDATAAAKLDIVGGHLYGSSPSDYPLARNKGKEIWMTEHYTSSNVDANSWPDALNVGKEVNDCMVNNFNAYIWWYIRRSYGFLDENGNVTKRGYVMSHFSKFVRPGYVRVNATVSPTSGVNVSAYVNGNTLVIVAINQNSSAKSITFSLSGGAVNSFTKYETTSSSNVANRGSVSGGSSMTNSLSGYSITTFVGTIGNGGSSGGTTISEGTFNIINRNSGQYLDCYNFGTTDGTNVVQWSGTGNTNQQWEITAVGDDYYRLSPVHAPDEALDVADYSSSDGANVQLWGYWGGECQQWKFIDVGDGYYQIEARHSGQLLEVVNALTENGANVQQWPANNHVCQHWSLQQLKSAPGSFGSEGIEKIASSSGIQVYPNPTDGNFTIQVPQADENEKLDISIFDLQGKSVYTNSMNSQNRISVNTDLRKGIYIIKVRSGDCEYTEKLVID
jgi:glucuronoarabinoxylan endo-1,4-beta-xylanase